MGIRTPLPIGQGFLSLVTLIQLRRHGASEISQVPGRPSFVFALLSDLGGTSASGHLTLWCCPRKHNHEDSRSVGTNEAQLHGFYDRCLRFMAVVTHGLMQNSLPVAGQALLGWIGYQQGRYERFQLFYFPLSQALLGAM